MFSLICGRQIQKINVYKNTTMIIKYVHTHTHTHRERERERERMFAIVGLFEGTRGRRKRKRE
jgi:hypothetical protein